MSSKFPAASVSTVEVWETSHYVPLRGWGKGADTTFSYLCFAPHVLATANSGFVPTLASSSSLSIPATSTSSPTIANRDGETREEDEGEGVIVESDVGGNPTSNVTTTQFPSAVLTFQPPTPTLPTGWTWQSSEWSIDVTHAGLFLPEADSRYETTGKEGKDGIKEEGWIYHSRPEGLLEAIKAGRVSTTPSATSVVRRRRWIRTIICTSAEIEKRITSRISDIESRRSNIEAMLECLNVIKDDVCNYENKRKQHYDLVHGDYQNSLSLSLAIMKLQAERLEKFKQFFIDRACIDYEYAKKLETLAEAYSTKHSPHHQVSSSAIPASNVSNVSGASASLTSTLTDSLRRQSTMSLQVAADTLSSSLSPSNPASQASSVPSPLSPTSSLSSASNTTTNPQPTIASSAAASLRRMSGRFFSSKSSVDPPPTASSTTSATTSSSSSSSSSTNTFAYEPPMVPLLIDDDDNDTDSKEYEITLPPQYSSPQIKSTKDNNRVNDTDKDTNKEKDNDAEADTETNPDQASSSSSSSSSSVNDSEGQTSSEESDIIQGTNQLFRRLSLLHNALAKRISFHASLLSFTPPPSSISHSIPPSSLPCTLADEIEGILKDLRLEVKECEHELRLQVKENMLYIV